MEQKIAIIHENTINMILEQQQRILQLLQGKANSDSGAFCSVREAAQILCVSEQKVRQMVDEGKLKKKENMGRAVRIYKSSLV
ncbi:helix-turn-helix domain-containing protein [Sulfurospirillum cavolei]|uniref:helix-turn-helix domain-containing protein n=1 Tax=Sulfurospirillum cavolei TaxID=366522 RepID=UPI0005AA0BF5|nr:helix-turn-helix domain-containing protein [Sulfurospirillum cavolei]